MMALGFGFLGVNFIGSHAFTTVKERLRRRPSDSRQLRSTTQLPPAWRMLPHSVSADWRESAGRRTR